MTPLVSVIVRSFHRPAALMELLGRLRTQQHDSFEVVILEQSDDPALVSRIEALGDHRLRVFPSAPLGPPGARNEAIRRARGEIMILVDDDDLPLGDGFIAAHVRNYDDPRCVGVVGRLVSDPSKPKTPLFPRLVRALAMRHTFFRDTVAYAGNTLRKENVPFLTGSNASTRRSLVARLGGWDEGIPMNEEQSFAFKFALEKRAGEHFVYDPVPAIWRRTDVPGGLERRTASDWHLRELESRLFYYEHVVGHYFPRRYRLLQPLFVARGIEHTFIWIWDPDNGHRSLGERARASLELVTKLPEVREGRRFPRDKVRWTAPWGR